jgi:outer membrane protein assembly factor BamB
MRDRYVLSLLVMCLLLVVNVSELLSPPAVRGNSSATEQASQPQPPSEEKTTAPAVTYLTDVVTYHYNNSRTGAMVHEQILTLSNVNSSMFGKIGFFPTDGKVDAEPLYLTNVFIQGVSHNVLYVVTEHASAYAFDADTGKQLWRVRALKSGETPSDNHGCNLITPEIGITDTPVIDRSMGPNGAIYFVAMSKDSAGHYHQRLHARDVTTGAELFGGPTEITAKYPGTGVGSQGGFVLFSPGQYAERVGLLESNGNIFLGWASHCDQNPYTGWLMEYSAKTLMKVSVLNLTPNGHNGAIWMSSAGLAADSAGNVFFLDGNGKFDTALNSQGFPSLGDYGNAFIKVSTSGALAVADYFNMYNTVAESAADEDLGSGGALLLPDLTDSTGHIRHLAVGAGKDKNIYVVNRDNMGKFNSTKNNIWEEIDVALPSGEFGMPAYYNHTVYYGGWNDHIKAFAVSHALLSRAPASESSHTFPYPGATPSLSANGTLNGILWVVENSNPAVLHAYKASDLSQELYNSNQRGSLDQFGPGNKFVTPMITNGKVFVGTQTGVAVFGLRHTAYEAQSH